MAPFAEAERIEFDMVGRGRRGKVELDSGIVQGHIVIGCYRGSEMKSCGWRCEETVTKAASAFPQYMDSSRVAVQLIIAQHASTFLDDITPQDASTFVPCLHCR